MQKTSLRLAVTGATGFVGTHLLKRLRALGYEIFPVTHQKNLEGWDPQNVFSYQGRLEDLQEFFNRQQINAVVHLAAKVDTQSLAVEADPMLDANIRLGLFCLEALKNRPGPCFFLNTGSFWQFDSHGAAAPNGLYAAFKNSFENFLHYYADNFSISVLSLILFDTYGPGDQRKKILDLVLQSAQQKTPLEMSPGEQQMSFVHIDDVVDAYCQVLQHWSEGEKYPARKYFVHGFFITLRHAVRDFLDVLQLDPSSILWDKKPYRERQIMTPVRGPTLPGWKPKYIFAQGVQDVYGKKI